MSLSLGLSLACSAGSGGKTSEESEATGEATATGENPTTSVTGASTITGASGMTVTGMTGASGTTGASDTSSTSSTSSMTGASSTPGSTEPTAGNVPPTAKLTDDLTADHAAPLEIEFSSVGSSDVDGSIVQVHWDFGDGAVADGEAVTHVYTEEGTYSLTVTVTDDDGATDSVTNVYIVGGCPKFAAAAAVGTLAKKALVEASGLAVSRRSPGVVWTHNDSEDEPHLYTFSDTGAALGVYTLQGAKVRDWEDMALGPGPKANQDYLYVGDIGDNNEKYDEVTVYRAPEPPVDPAMTGVTASIGGVESFELVYPGDPRNSETMLVDPISGDLYLISKSVDGTSLVFRAAAPLKSGTLEQVGQIEFGPGGLTTGGSVSTAGDWVLVRTYFVARMWHRGTGMALHEALAGAGCNVNVAMEKQGEAISFAAQGVDYFTTSEGEAPPLYRYARG